jgi:SsrA-binding protein
MANQQIKKSISIHNRKASHEYHFLEKFVAGMVLKGSEIKSIRMGKINLQDAFCLVVDGQVYVRGLHITPYVMGGFHNHEAKAERKLLLSKREIAKLEDKSKDQGLTIVPTKVFVNDRGWAKMEIAIAKGKKLYDKRGDLKEKDMKREMRERF